MIEIDGSFGEGGGQLLRYSAAIAALTGKDIKVYNIRAKRSNPGLRPQHLTALKFIARLVDAETEGLRVGSTQIILKPRRKRPKGGRFTVDIGTAGSVTLFLQAVVPVLLAADSEIELEVRGGTSVKWSPPYPYFENVLVPLFRKFGAKIETKLVRRGFYPQGGGIVRIVVEPSYPLNPINITQTGEPGSIRGISYVGNLPCHIAERQYRAAKSYLESKGLKVEEIVRDCRTPAIGKGTGIVLWTNMAEGIVGSDSLGERGKPAEAVGREAAEKLFNIIKNGAPIDPHASDNLIIYMSLANGMSQILTSEMTSHAKTALHLCSMIAGSEHSVSGVNGNILIKVKGIGLSP
ncbi:MAG: RNA 3'-phosphate cyclase [Thermoprotei archaeon]|nr:MAG: RNA 3'-phosphate cyclase [Thermoprotei archaeon]